MSATSKLGEIKRDIMSMSSDDVRKLSEWLDEFKNELWDQQIETDAEAGRLTGFVAQALTEGKAGKALARTFFRGTTQ